MKNLQGTRARIIGIIAAVILALILASAVISANNGISKAQSADYGFFLDSIAEGSVTRVDIGERIIRFETETNGIKKLYTTAKVDDPELITRLYESGNINFGGVNENGGTSAETLLGLVIPAAFFIVFFRMTGKRLGMGAGIGKSVGKSSARMYVKSADCITFEDVAGQDEAKDALSEIVDFLHDPAKYAEIGADMPKGALLVGPPGTGKTLLARAVAGEAEVPFFSASGSEFVEMFVGVGASKIRDLFKQAKEKAPCIIFIDEIDTIGKRRDGSVGGNDEREQTLNQLLTEMDGFDGKRGIVILAATNRPESLDAALLRPGRFDRRIPVELPDLRGREAILRVHADRVKLARTADLPAIARATAGASGAELANIINEAALRAVRNGRGEVEQADMEEAVEIVIAGYQRKNAVIPEQERRIIAYHEIGHALVAAKQKGTAPVHKITIIPRTNGALGYTMLVEEDERSLMTREELTAKITTYTGGRAAEELVFGTFTGGASNDIEQATKIARMMVTRLGMSEGFDMIALETGGNRYLGDGGTLNCSPDTAARIDGEINAIVRRCHERAGEILRENAEKLREAAEFLLERETITGEEFMCILNKETAPVL